MLSTPHKDQAILLLETIHVKKTIRILQPYERKLARGIRTVFNKQLAELLAVLERSYQLQESDVKNDIDQALSSVNTFFANLLNKAVKEIIKIGALAAIDQLQLGISFAIVNPLVVAYLKNYGGEQVTRINETTRKIIADIVTTGIQNGTPYTILAQELRDKFREFSTPIKRPKHIRDRAELIAVDQLARGYQYGNYASVQTAKDVLGIQFEKKWETVGDDRVSDGCRENSNMGWIPMEQEYRNGVVVPPRFPGCRCAEAYRRIKSDPNLSKQELKQLKDTSLPVRSFSSGSEADEYFKKNRLHKKFNIEQLNVLNFYQANGYEQINGYLRGLTIPRNKEALDYNIGILDKMFKASILKDNIQVYRGLGADIDDQLAIQFMETLVPGIVFQDKGYTSTTVDPAVAERFGWGTASSKFLNTVSLTIKIPAGTPALYMPTVNPNKLTQESELLLPRGTLYKVISREVKNGVTYIELEVIPNA